MARQRVLVGGHGEEIFLFEKEEKKAVQVPGRSGGPMSFTLASSGGLRPGLS